MKKIVKVILGAFIATSCTDNFVQEVVVDSKKMIPSGKVWVSDAIVKLSKYGMTDPEGFIKQGNLLVVGRSFEDFQVRAIDIRTEECRGLLRFGEGEHHAVGITSLSIGPFGSVTALDFQSGRLHDRL